MMKRDKKNSRMKMLIKMMKKKKTKMRILITMKSSLETPLMLSLQWLKL
jgi:hypothetical protein